MRNPSTVENQGCERCGSPQAHRYQEISYPGFGEDPVENLYLLCTACARRKRKTPSDSPAGPFSLNRRDLIAALDRFFEASGVFEICARCHSQGTGCCPPTCRVMGPRGCDPGNSYGKTVFCAAFICGALINALSECDPEIGRTLKWIKKEIGPAEFRIYEMIARVPAETREPVRPIALPRRYPAPPNLDNGGMIREKLLRLADEVLEIRRVWNGQEAREVPPVDPIE